MIFLLLSDPPSDVWAIPVGSTFKIYPEADLHGSRHKVTSIASLDYCKSLRTGFCPSPLSLFSKAARGILPKLGQLQTLPAAPISPSPVARGTPQSGLPLPLPPDSVSPLACFGHFRCEALHWPFPLSRVLFLPPLPSGVRSHAAHQ